MKKIIIALLLFPLLAVGQVESPPTLALGVAGVVGEKGSIDIDVLAQLISEKQGELKKEFIKKTIFRDLEGQSYVVWEYVHNSLDILLESESKEAIKKNLLEQTSNLALVYGFAELYLQLSSKMCNSSLDSLLMSYDTAYKSNEYACRVIRNPASLKVKLHSLKEYKHDGITFSSFFIDLVFELLRNDKSVQELGFLSKSLPLNYSYYKGHSAYFRIKKKLPNQTNSLYNRMRQEIEILFNNYQLVRKWSDNNTSLNTLVAQFTAKQDTLSRKKGVSSPDTLYRNLIEETSNIYEALQSKNVRFGISSLPSGANVAIAYTENENNKELSEAIEKNLAAFKRFAGRGTAFTQDDLFYLEKSIRPLLIRLVTENGFNPSYLQTAEDLEVMITTALLKQLQSTLNGSSFVNLAAVNISQFSELLDFITHLDELDKVETYQFVFNVLKEASEIFEDKKLGFYLKSIVENVDKYTIINSDENKVEVAVEDIITRIYEKYANRQSSVFSLYFSIGANQSIQSNFSVRALLPDSTGFRTDSIKSIAFASEKIGLKVKLVDFKWRRSFEYGETYQTRLTGKSITVSEFKSREPLVSDIYFLAYGSGILYKIADLTSDKQFQDPIAGLGVGVSFFNSLDLNIGYNWPLQADNGFFENFDKKNIWTISFDVKITEYLSALGKKRKADK